MRERRLKFRRFSVARRRKEEGGEGASDQVTDTTFLLFAHTPSSSTIDSMRAALALLVTALLWAGQICMTVATASGSQVLVVYDASFDKAQYSTYLSTLEAQGLQLHFRSVKEPKPVLFDHEETAFDHLLLFAPSTKSLPADLSPQRLVDFLQQSGNVLFALSSELTETYRDLGREFDIELEEKGTTLIDHFASLKSDKHHSTVAVDAAHINKLEGIFAGLSVQEPFLFKGVVHRSGLNPLVFPLLTAPATSYSFEVPEDLSTIERLDNPDRESVLGGDPNVALISAFQLLDTERRGVDDGPKRLGSAGRAVWIGSVEAFSNDFFNAKKVKTRDGRVFQGSSNRAVLSAITSWLTQQRGVLHVEQTAHSRVKMHDNDVRESYEEFDIEDDAGQRRIQRMYRIKDTVTFNIDLTQRTPSGWQPAPTDLDLQVSLIMLDPYITTNLSTSAAQSIPDVAQDQALEASPRGSPRATRYSTTFQLPDRHGVYTFVVDWRRHGWTYIHTRDTSPVRPYNHDEHPRGLHSAWPYVVGSTSTMAAFLLFVFLWITSQEDERTEEERQRKDE